MNRLWWLVLMAVAAGCINGAPLPPTPASSRAVPQISVNGELQDEACINLAQNYLRSLGKDPTQARYVVHRNPPLDDEAGADESSPVAVIDVSFLDGNVWHLALKSDGDLSLLAN